MVTMATMMKGTVLVALALIVAARGASQSELGDEFLVKMEQESAHLRRNDLLNQRLLRVAKVYRRAAADDAVQDDAAAAAGDDAAAVVAQDDDAKHYVNADGIAVTAYALKYVGCQNIHTWSDDLAADNTATSPLTMNRFVIVRLCKQNDCSSYNKNGCNSNYGEYLVPMEEYLAIMADYHFADYSQYCKACYYCMNHGAQSTAYSNSSSNQYTADDDANNRKLQYYGYYSANRNGEYSSYNNNNNGQNYYSSNTYNQNSGYYNNANNNGNNYANGQSNTNAYASYINSYGQCTLQTTCENYRTTCANFRPNAIYYEDYFQCTQFTIGNNVGYLGPHCNNDGHTIDIAIYEDDSCSTYLGNSSQIQKWTGKTFSDDELANFYDKNCISCLNADSYGLVTDYEIQNQNGGNNDNAMYEVNALCEVMYESSAKCNRNLGLADAYGDADENQQLNENATCDYIKAVIENNYDQSGDLASQYREFSTSNWQSPQEYYKLAQKVSSFQIVGLVFSILACLSLLVYSCTLHGKLMTRKKRSEPWTRPTKSEAFPDAPPGADPMTYKRTMHHRDIDRANSGIVAMRSEDAAVEGIMT